MILPQILVCVILACGIIRSFVRNGEVYVGEHDFVLQAIKTLIWIALLTWGGFFRGGTL